MKRYKALILDMDGTIMDSLDASERALSDTCRKWNIPMTEKLLSLILYSSTDALMEALDLGENAGHFLGDLSDAYRRHDHLIKAFPGIEALADAPVPKGIVTSETRTELLQNLDKLGIPARSFAAFSCAGDIPFLKPHPLPLLHCLEQMGAKPTDALYVGDSVNDLLCAKAAGVDFGLARWGARDSKACASAEYSFLTPGEILGLLDSQHLF